MAEAMSYKDPAVATQSLQASGFWTKFGQHQTGWTGRASRGKGPSVILSFWAKRRISLSFL